MRNNNLTRPNRFYRGIAIFFLIFTVFDLSSPALCQEDGLEGSAIAHQGGRSVQTVARNEGFPTDRSDDQPGSDIEGHDCFCCCTHLSLVDIVRIVDLNVRAHVVPGNIGDPPLASPHGIDHPPRLA